MTEQTIIETNEETQAGMETAAQETEAETGTTVVPLDERFSYPYWIHKNNLGIVKEGREGEVFIPICTFIPYIEAELTYDDGAETTKQYRIGGIDNNGCLLPSVDVPAGDLEKPDWMVNHWDSSCDLCVVPHAREHLRAAIKQTGRFAERKTIYAHTGWKKINDTWHFLLPGEDSRYEVRLQGKQKNYESGQSVSEEDLSILAGLLDADLAPKRILYPCLSMVFLSPLNEFLKQVGHEPKFILTLIGRSGSKKSTLAALMMSFFGRFTLTDLPMSFHDTANSIIYNAFTLKDVLTVVDDYHPTARRDSDVMKSIMQTLARGYGDRAGRNRLTTGITLREARPPQGNVIVTAEFPPDIGESGTARLFNVEMSPEDLNLQTLTQYQEYAEAGVFRRCLYGYTAWLAHVQLENEQAEAGFLGIIKVLYKNKREMWRGRLKEKAIPCHDRLPDTLACLTLGFDLMLCCLRFFEVLDKDAEARYKESWTAELMQLAAGQSDAVTQDKPSHIFIRKLTALLECGQIRVMPVGALTDLPPGCVGYEDEEAYYLFLDLAHKTVKRFCEEQDESFSISAKALAKALVEEGFAEADAASGHHTQQLRFSGKRKRVLVLKKNTIAAAQDAA